MFKRILVFLVLILSFTFVAAAPTEMQKAAWDNATPAQKQEIANQLTGGDLSVLEANLKDGIDGKITKALSKAVSDAAAAGGGTECTGPNKLCSPEFEIKVSDISPGGKFAEGKSSAQETGRFVLQAFINKMIVGFGVLALLIMTIGGGYMVFYHGQDELLSKGKSIFTAGIISLIVALGSGMLVKIVAYILY